MTSFDRFERNLPDLLEALAAPRRPDYADDLFARTAASRQRPGWTFPERWIPMSALTGRFAAVPRIPWRLGALVALLAVAAIVGLLVVGSKPVNVPAPFGPAANGVIPYISNGNLYVGDPVSGTTRLLVDVPEDLGLPQFSPDGTRIAYLRVVMLSGTQFVNIHTVRADGSDTRLLTPNPLVDADWKWIAWTPDGRQIAVAHAVDGVGQLDIIDASGNGTVKRITAAAGIDSLQYRPPGGGEILFRACVEVTTNCGLYVMDADGTNVRLLVAPATNGDTLDLTGAVYSADGSRVFYNRWTSNASGGEAGCCQLYVIGADGGAERQFISNTGVAWDGQAVVSPNGALIAFWHNQNDSPTHGVFVIRADGTGPLVETGPLIPGTAHWVWAPDSSKILMYMNGDSDTEAYLLDPDGGPWTTVPWRSDNDIDWQRVAN